MLSRVLIIAFSMLAFGCADRTGGDDRVDVEAEGAAAGFRLPGLSESDYTRIAQRIYRSEAGADPAKLTHWNEGEDFPSLGIGHFIWFPTGVDAPFDESFPPMLEYVRQHTEGCAALPAWLAELDPVDAPWSDKAAFDAAADSPAMQSLRLWLESTMSAQVRYIVASFERRWSALSLPGTDKERLNRLLERITSAPQGLYAVIDYYNFKGLGNNPRERYADEGWGLVQVLSDVADTVENTADDVYTAAELTALFADAAAERLIRRAALAPPERNEQRWIPGWTRRTAEYRNDPDSMGSGFRVKPYVRHLTERSVMLQWYSRDSNAGRLTVAPVSEDGERHFDSVPEISEALTYHVAEPCLAASALEFAIPYRHQLTVDELEPGREYRYEVAQGGFVAEGRFRTPSDDDRALRFIVYADSETEPESTGKRTLWPAPGEAGSTRLYPVDQTTGYAANLDVIKERAPRFVAIAGDLVESGGEQRDWDEFWRHNSALAASTPIYPAPGNHDYYGGPGELGRYGTAASGRAIRKYRNYFSWPERNTAEQTYYAVRHGPLTLIVLDVNNGLPERSDGDTNWFLSGEDAGGPAPGWQTGSAQAEWLEATLERAQRNSAFTFVMMHPAPYASGVHNRPPGTDEGQDFASGVPLRSLTPMFLRYGVDAVFSGHDEMLERSVVSGMEVRPNGERLAHELQFVVAGIGGDGLRGPHPGVDNPVGRFLADRDAPERYDANGVLEAGGKHYGHVEVNLERDAEGRWQARLEPVYVLPLTNAEGQLLGFERRVYDDVVILDAAANDTAGAP